MKQLIQVLRSGLIEIRDVPIPYLEDKFILVKNRHSLISAGTEKTKIDMGKKNLFEKAKARPDLVKQVIEKARSQGIKKTMELVNNRLDGSSPLGYSSAGEVIAVGGLVKGIQVGDLVACAGAGFANHSEVIAVPQNLVIKIPDNVSTKEAAFTTLGAIALQGVRLASPRIGETYLIIGLGLIGQITAQLLKANGCFVIGTDLDESLVEMINDYNCEGVKNDIDIVEYCKNRTNGYGVDGVIICAATKSNTVIETSGEVTREKGKVVIIGAVKMDIPRETFYKKEIDFVISRSYGPGRYDPSFEEEGIDYPLPYVRFTQQRNMDSFLKLLSTKAININGLITHEYDFKNAKQAYDLISNKTEKYIGILLSYKNSKNLINHKKIVKQNKIKNLSEFKASFYGAGNYATGTIIPILKKIPSLSLGGVSTNSGLSAKDVAQKFKFEYSASCLSEVIKGSNILFISSIHSNHAESVIFALQKKMHVYVDKPLCLTLDELKKIDNAYEESKNSDIIVGFNRRYSPAVKEVINHFKTHRNQMIINIRVNAGKINDEHWINNPKKGGGRILGEACHFIDLASYIVNSPVKSVFSQSLNNSQRSICNNDNLIINLSFKNGCIASIIYTSLGDKKLGKEYIEIFGGERSATINDFRNLSLYKNNKLNTKKDYGFEAKGQKEMFENWFHFLKNNNTLMSYESIRNSTIATIACLESLSIGEQIQISE